MKSPEWWLVCLLPCRHSALHRLYKKGITGTAFFFPHQYLNQTESHLQTDGPGIFVLSEKQWHIFIWFVSVLRHIGLCVTMWLKCWLSALIWRLFTSILRDSYLVQITVYLQKNKLLEIHAFSNWNAILYIVLSQCQTKLPFVTSCDSLSLSQKSFYRAAHVVFLSWSQLPTIIVCPLIHYCHIC